MAPPKSKRTVQTDVWTFNLRSNQTNQDSDSDSDSPDDTPTTNSETQLLNDLDLSTREETVVYKPNPFSIAKINAASRPTRAPTPIIDRRPAKKPAPKKPQGRIVDSFNFKKKQKKALHPSPTQPKATKSASTNVAPAHANAAIVPPHSMTPALDAVPRLDKPEDLDLSPVPTLAIAEKPSCPSMIDADVLPHTASAHTSSVLPSPPAQRIILKRKFRPPAPVSFSSPLKAPSLAVRGAITSNQGPRNLISFSSPIRPAQPAPLYPVYSIAVPSYQSKYPLGKSVQTLPVQANSTFYPHRTINKRAFIALEIFSLNSEFTSESESKLTPHVGESLRMLIPSSPSSGPHAFPAESATVLSHHRPPLPFYPNNQPTDIASTQRAESNARSQSGLSQLRDIYDVNLPPQLPPSSPIQSPTATPSPSPRRARKRLSPHKSNRTLKRQKRDAYDYLRSDPDDEWTTLPVRKKPKAAERIKPRTNGIRTTAAFRFPGSSTTKAKVIGMSATSQRRVVTFLPPPLKAGKVEVLVEDAGPRREQPLPFDVDGVSSGALKHPRGSRESSPSRTTPKRRRLPENPYPSPANSRLTPGNVTNSICDKLRAAPPDALSSPTAIQLSMHRIPSPPTSDPLPEYDLDVPTVVTVGSVSQKYPRTKDLMRQRKHDTIWDLLNLPSCGIVHRDNDPSLSTDLPVVLWEGQQKEMT
ncbi:hypothetical protein C8R44DRAFT_743345 [Mycena epipterygia]|nr:hypothetical protein C8R44DRAFT_743345 [Mycena epipterygia]